MKHSMNKQIKSSKELATLTDSWWTIREEELQEVKEMLKYPLLLQQMKEQTQRNKMTLRESNMRNS